MRLCSTITAIIGLLAACGDNGVNDEVPLSNLGFQAFATSNAGVVTIEVTLTTADPNDSVVNFYALRSDEALVIQLGSAALALTEQISTTSGVVRYQGSLESTNAARLLVVDFSRGRTALSSRVTLPSAFEIVRAPDSHPRGSDLQIEWDVQGEVPTSRVVLEGDCVIGSEVRIDADPGSATIPASAFERPEDQSGDGPCESVIIVDRISEGVVDDRFGRSGRIESAQSQTASLLVTVP